MSWLWIPVSLCVFIRVCVQADSSTSFSLTDFRLITKSRPNVGIVEGFAEGVGWGIMCGAEDYFDFHLAEMVCSRLNFPGTALKFYAADFLDELASKALMSRKKFSCNRDADDDPLCSVLISDHGCDPRRVPAVTCKVDLGFCSDPDVPVTGSLVATPGSGPFPYGSTVSFSCSDGLFLVGKSSLQCVGVGNAGIAGIAGMSTMRSKPEGSNMPTRLGDRHAVGWSGEIPACSEIRPTKGVGTSLPINLPDSLPEMKSSDVSPISQENNDNKVRTTYIVVAVSCVVLITLVAVVISIFWFRSRRRSKMSTSDTAKTTGCRLDDNLTTPSSTELTVQSTYYTGNEYDIVGNEATERPLCPQEADGEPRQTFSGMQGNGAGVSREIPSANENEVNPSSMKVYENTDFHEIPLMEENELYGT